MFLGQQLANLVAVDSALVVSDVFGWQQQIDTVWFSAGLLLDPAQFTCQSCRAVRDSPQDAEAAGFGDGSHHVSTVAERTDRELHAEHFRHSRPHRNDGTNY